VPPVRKAVFPAAGLGTRFLPATKAQPKEMLPLVDKPIIQYGVEEAVASGIDNIILVTGRGKNAIEDHFDVSVELESFSRRAASDLLEEVRKISNLINFAYVRQGEPLGLGHAVLVTRAGRRRALRRHPGRRCHRRGSAGDEAVDRGLRAARRPGARGRAGAARRDLELRRHRRRGPTRRSATASTRSAISWKSRRRKRPRRISRSSAATCDAGHLPGAGEDQERPHRRDSADQRAARALEDAPDLRLRGQGVRHDTGNKLGFLKAVVYFALRQPDLAAKFSAYLTSLDLKATAGKR
jgi:UTP--glucose-1-phosphate uridylyltransferase